jgi:Holliday junction resolvase RusA-like endonuclease
MPEWKFPLNPVAAVLGDYFTPYECPLRVDVELFVKRPKTTKLDMPRPDIDNFLKSIFDVLNKKLWLDDNIIRSVYATKQWAEEGEDGYFIIGVDNAVPRVT